MHILVWNCQGIACHKNSIPGYIKQILGQYGGFLDCFKLGCGIKVLAISCNCLSILGNGCPSFLIYSHGVPAEDNTFRVSCRKIIQGGKIRIMCKLINIHDVNSLSRT